MTSDGDDAPRLLQREDLHRLVGATEVGWTPAGFAIALCFAEVIVVGATVMLNLPMLIGVGVHLALLVAAGASAVRCASARQDQSSYLVILLAALATGPLGAAAAGIGVVMLGRELPDKTLLAAWYDRIAQAGELDTLSRITTSIAMGRTVDTTGALPVSFERVIAEGSLQERQAALGLIARRFSPAYAPALRAALVSSEPVIRVQAAAVAVKVRAQAKTELEEDLARVAAVPHPLPVTIARAALGRISALVNSGLLEDRERQQGEVVRAQLVASLVTDLDLTSLDSTRPSGAAVRELLETELLRQGRFAEFRDLRSTAAAGLATPHSGPSRGGPNA
jgi:hypothetical protein